MDITRLRALGYSIVPGTADKKPLIPWGQWRDTPQTDAEFAAIGHGSVYGILTGQAHGLVVLDFDGQEGARLMAELGLAPNVTTGSGGYHVWLDAAAIGYPVKTCAAVRPGLDVRGEGGLVWTLGRSRKGEYSIHGTALLVPTRPILFSLLPERTEPLGSADLGEWDGEGMGTENALRVLRAKAAEVAAAVPGTRNATLNRAAFTVGGLVAAGELDADDAAAVLIAAAERANTDGLWPRIEMAKCIAAAFSAGSASPWNASPAPGWKEAGHNRSAAVPEPVTGPAWTQDRLPLPLDAFPKAVQALVTEGAAVTAAPPEFIAAATIPALGLAAGGYVRLDLRQGWILTPHCYMALVGPPSTSKTPALALALAPASAAEDTAWRNAADDGPANRYLVDDATTEKLGELLNANPRGLMLFTDELKGFFGGLSQYKQGGQGRDRQFYLSAWSAQSFSVDRIKRGSMRVIDPALSIVGGIQPSVFSDLVIQGAEDGMTERFLFVYGDPVAKTWIEDDVSAGTLRAYADLWNDLRDWGGDDRVVRLTAAARAEWTRWYDSFHAELPGLGDRFVPMAGKAGTHVAKLALLLACCDQSAVTPEHVQRAVRITEYFLAEHCHVLRVAGASSAVEKKHVKEREDLNRWLEEFEAKHGRLPSKKETLQNGPAGSRTAKARDVLLDELGVVL